MDANVSRSAQEALRALDEADVELARLVEIQGRLAEAGRQLGSLVAQWDPNAENAQMLKVQMSMQRENRMFTSVSNVLKSRHEAVKSAIANIR